MATFGTPEMTEESANMRIIACIPTASFARQIVLLFAGLFFFIIIVFFLALVLIVATIVIS